MNKLEPRQVEEWATTLSGEEFKQRIEERDLKLLPALIDSHVHFRVPGGEQKEDWATGSTAAAAGGVCAVIDMPNNTPPILTLDALKKKIALVDKQNISGIKAFFHVGATDDQIPEPECAEYAVGVKVYYGASTGDLLINSSTALHWLYETWPSVIVVHAEKEEVIQENSDRLSGNAEPIVHSKIRSREAAIQAVEEVLSYVRQHQKPTYFAHVSTKEEVELVRKAKKEGLPVYAEVTPHHLFLNEEAYERWGNYVKVNPPLRTIDDNKALWKGIEDGTIDVLGTDHAPHLPEEKEKPYAEAPSGIPEIDTVVPLMLNAVREGKLTYDKLIELMHSSPMKIFGLKGLERCWTVVDPEAVFLVEKEKLHTKCGWSPYEGMELKGAPVFTIVDNKVINE